MQDWSDDLGDWTYNYQSFLTLAEKPDGNIEGIQPIQELHFGCRETASPKNLGQLVGSPCLYSAETIDKRTLEYEEDIVSGDAKEIWQKWLEIIFLAAKFDSHFTEFFCIDDVLMNRASMTTDCWDASQAIAEILSPGVQLTDHFDGVAARGYEALINKIKEQKWEKDIQLASDITLAEIITATYSHLAIL